MSSILNDPIDHAMKELAQARLALAAARAAAPLTQWCRQLPPAAARAATSNVQNKPAGARHTRAVAHEAECQNKPAGARHDLAVAQGTEFQNKPAGARRDWQTDDDDPTAQNKPAGARRPLTERQQLAARILGRNRGTLSAAARVGVNRHTIPRWMRLPAFADAVERERQSWDQRRTARLAARHARHHPPLAVKEDSI